MYISIGTQIFFTEIRKYLENNAAQRAACFANCFEEVFSMTVPKFFSLLAKCMQSPSVVASALAELVPDHPFIVSTRSKEGIPLAIDGR